MRGLAASVVKFAAISANEEPPLGIEPRTFSLRKL